MDQNPYSGGGYGAEIYAEPERTSIAAVLSLISSLICCIPGLPVLGVVLGAFGLIGIGRSNGRVGGRGLAIAGIVLGLLFTAGQLGIALGGRSIVKMFLNQIAVNGSEVLLDVQGGDFAGARSKVAGNLSTASDETLIAFREAYKAEMGEFVSTPQTLGELINGYATAGHLMQNYQGRNDLIPVPAKFTNDEGLIILVIDQTGRTPPAAGMKVPMVDLIVVSSAGTEYKLSDFAQGVPAPVPAPEAAPETAPGSAPEEEPEGP